MQQALLWAALGPGFTFLMTTLGSASVFLFRGKKNALAQRIFLGFAAGVMIAASVWSLLIPALERAEEAGQLPLVPAIGGFVLGVAFLMAVHRLLPHGHVEGKGSEGMPAPRAWGRPMLLFTAMTIHNIPEGMSVGLLFAMAGLENDPVMLGLAIALALGMGLQNIPEGAAVSLPLYQEGVSAPKAFAMGAFSGIMEPVFGISAVLLASVIAPYMPWLLAFSAGAMMFVVVEELIPEAHLGEQANVGTIAVLVGFLIMMTLDVALG